MTAQQVAEVLNKSPRTVARMAEDGRLSYAHKLPGRHGAYLFDRAVIEQLVDETYEQATERLARIFASEESATVA